MLALFSLASLGGRLDQAKFALKTPAGRRQIRVHLVEAKDYSPIANAKIEVLDVASNGDQGPLNYNTTDKNGTVIVPLSDPPPPGLFVTAPDNDKFAGCSQAFACTQRILAQGVDEPNLCWPFLNDSKPEPTVQSRPGEIYTFEHRASLWDRF